MQNELNDLLTKAKELLKEETTKISYETWIKVLEIQSEDNGHIVLLTSTDFQKNVVSSKYLDLLTNTFNYLTNKDCTVSIVSREELEAASNNADLRDATSIEAPINYATTNLNPKYTFSTFVVGNNNRFAHAAALAVAEAPAASYNPLYLYGGVGLGKTHLMHAIGNYIVQKSNKKVLYVTSEEFISDFIGINKKDENNYDIVSQFKEKYRNIDILMIDDIQFLGGAAKTQQEFFHTFTNLYDSNKQIIISSDRSPDDLKLLEERLLTRFRWGLTANIEPPDFELRCKILKDKMTGHEVAKMVPNEVIEYIATNCENDVRHLEGAITRLYAYAAMMGPKEINLEFAVDALKDYIGKSIYITNDIQKIQKAVADYYHITIEDLKSKKRTSNINYPRQIAMYLCRMTTSETIIKIGLEFGNRDHSTVLHSYDKINNEIQNDENNIRQVIEDIKNKIVN